MLLFFEQLTYVSIIINSFARIFFLFIVITHSYSKQNLESMTLRQEKHAK